MVGKVGKVESFCAVPSSTVELVKRNIERMRKVIHLCKRCFRFLRAAS